MAERRPRPPSPVAAWAAVAALLFLAATARLIALDAQPLWWDEGWSVYFASLPLGQMLSATALDIHPPLYYALLRLWAGAFGFAPVSLRLLSVACGIAVVGGAYLVARLLLGRRGGLLAGLLVALAPMQVYYSQEVRMYALVAALGAASWYALLRAEDGGGRRWRGAYVALAGLALYAEYYSALLWLGQAIYGFAHRRSGNETIRQRARSRLYLLAPAALFLPWLAYALPNLVAYVGAKQAIEGYRALDPLTYTWSYLSAFAAGQWVGEPQPRALVWATAATLLALVAVGLWAVRRDGRFLALVGSYLVLPLALGYVVNLVFPFTPRFFERVLLFASPPLYLLAAAGCLALRRGAACCARLREGEPFATPHEGAASSAPTRRAPGWRTSAVLALGTLAALLPSAHLYYLWTVPRYPEGDYRPVFAAIRRLGSERDSVLCLHPWQYGYAVAYLPERLRHPYMAPVGDWESATARREGLERLLDQSARVWFPAHQSLGRILEQEVAADLDSVGYRALEEWHGGETLLLTHAPSPEQWQAGETGSFEQGPALSASAFAPSATLGAGALAVRLDWASMPPPGLQGSVRLQDERGVVWASRDFALSATEQGLAILLPWGTPATALELALVVSRDGVELQPAGQLPADPALLLGAVQLFSPEESTPGVESLGLRSPAASFAGGIRLVGQETLVPEVKQGNELPIELWWTLDRLLSAEPILFVQGLDGEGAVVAALEERVTGGTWPMPMWPIGALVRDPHRLPVPASAKPGALRIVAGLLDAETRQPLAAAGKTQVTLGEVRVMPVARTFEQPRSDVAVGVGFGELATLVGYSLAPCQSSTEVCTVEGQSLTLDIVWRAEKDTGARYQSFVHLLAGERIVAQSAHQPGDLPTTAWLPGQYVADRHTLDLSAWQADDGPLTLVVGLYDPATGQRIEPQRAESKDGRLVLTEVDRRQ